MKVTNWCKKLRGALVAAGLCVPGAAYAQNIPLLDPSFETPPVPGIGYSYSNTYRPTSPWVDDLDNPNGYFQDDGASNWLYSAAYAESTTFTKRPAPRTGNQAMHGLFNYSAQETSTLFEANKSYTFSLWAQNDVLLNETNGVFLYIFDGTVPFSDENALTGQLFTAINQRGAAMTAAQSMANWTQISIQHNVLPGAPEIGHPIGVGFFGRKDSAVDDATLTAAPIDPGEFTMFITVNTTNGQVSMKNQTGETVHIDYYEITSPGSSLHATNWNSFQEPAGNPGGFPSGDGSGNGWEEFGGSSSKVIGESYLTGSSAVPHSTTSSISLGAAFRTGMPQDLVFKYGQLGTPVPLDGDFNGDFKVDAADYVVWRKTIGTPAAFTLWKANFGNTGGPIGPSTLVQGFVQYVTSGSGSGSAVPEPSSVLLIGIGLCSLVAGGRQRSKDN
jgi:hypothetical protein